jgi:hypothetical protein
MFINVCSMPLSIVDYVFFFFFLHLNCRIKSWTNQLVLLLDLLILVLLHLGLVFWILILVLVLQLSVLKILVQLFYQNLKKNKQTSTVWEHFTKLVSSDPGNHKSQCNYYKREFNCHPKSHSTSSMLQHIRKNCKKYPSRFDKT